MKTAICYRGHYYREEPHGSNFFLNFENNKEMLWKCFSEYDVFLHTYSVNNQLDTKLVDLIKPKNYEIETNNSTEIRNSILKVNSLVTSEYDFVVNLRFDLLFNTSFNTFDIEYNKFNFCGEKENQCGLKKEQQLIFYLRIIVFFVKNLTMLTEYFTIIC